MKFCLSGDVSSCSTYKPTGFFFILLPVLLRMWRRLLHLFSSVVLLLNVQHDRSSCQKQRRSPVLCKGTTKSNCWIIKVCPCVYISWHVAALWLETQWKRQLQHSFCLSVFPPRTSRPTRTESCEGHVVSLKSRSLWCSPEKPRGSKWSTTGQKWHLLQFLKYYIVHIWIDFRHNVCSD